MILLYGSQMKFVCNRREFDNALVTKFWSVVNNEEAKAKTTSWIPWMATCVCAISYWCGQFGIEMSSRHLLPDDQAGIDPVDVDSLTVSDQDIRRQFVDSLKDMSDLNIKAVLSVVQYKRDSLSNSKGVPLQHRRIFTCMDKYWRAVVAGSYSTVCFSSESSTP